MSSWRRAERRVLGSGLWWVSARLRMWVREVRSCVEDRDGAVVEGVGVGCHFCEMLVWFGMYDMKYLGSWSCGV